MFHRARFCALLFAILMGCSGGTVYYAEGVDLVTRNSDYASCDAIALEDYPVQNEMRTAPAVYHPASQVCTADGICSQLDGYWAGGQSYLYDTNANARATASRSCMSTRGYARVGLPDCDLETELRISTVMPELTDGTCLLRRDSSPALIVNPLESDDQARLTD